MEVGVHLHLLAALPPPSEKKACFPYNRLEGSQYLPKNSGDEKYSFLCREKNQHSSVTKPIDYIMKRFSTEVPLFQLFKQGPDSYAFQ
jgi:hypothetical protein